MLSEAEKNNSGQNRVFAKIFALFFEPPISTAPRKSALGPKTGGKPRRQNAQSV